MSSNPECPIEVQSHWAVMGVAPEYERFNSSEHQPKKKRKKEGRGELSVEDMDAVRRENHGTGCDRMG